MKRKKILGIIVRESIIRPHKEIIEIKQKYEMAKASQQSY